ncbi:hypothetical protein MY04_3740 [Flammeovirga sp. MY04]|uniref:hypothetical protein n=1 Tax=Flammeovirga sp. MY04 TaxID=1191459 RepID=UPI0008062BBD|nr:hypothetical protein [Flammeovirga sp. MY04]ANQ51084.1 hypothetical protein MY04_3740 [Flammeovirga sp. MY04]
MINITNIVTQHTHSFKQAFITILFFIGGYTTTFAQENKISSITIYKVEDEGLLDNELAQERVMISIFNQNVNESWRFFFENKKLMALACDEKKLDFIELLPSKRQYFYNSEQNINVSFKLKNDDTFEILITKNTIRLQSFLLKIPSEKLFFLDNLNKKHIESS